jgi:hypothetical protein
MNVSSNEMGLSSETAQRFNTSLADLGEILPSGQWAVTGSLAHSINCALYGHQQIVNEPGNLDTVYFNFLTTKRIDLRSHPDEDSLQQIPEIFFRKPTFFAEHFGLVGFNIVNDPPKALNNYAKLVHKTSLLGIDVFHGQRLGTLGTNEVSIDQGRKFRVLNPIESLLASASWCFVQVAKNRDLFEGNVDIYHSYRKMVIGDPVLLATIKRIISTDLGFQGTVVTYNHEKLEQFLIKVDSAITNYPVQNNTAKANRVMNYPDHLVGIEFQPEIKVVSEEEFKTYFRSK